MSYGFQMVGGGLVSRTENAMRGGAGAAANKPTHSPKDKQDQAGNMKENGVDGEVSQKTQQLAPGDKSGTERGRI